MKSIVILQLLILLSITAFAGRVENGGNVVIDHPVYDNLYITSGTVTINAPVRGDIVAMAGSITINDSVSGDILIAGGNVTLNGYAGDDIRCIGGTLMVLKNVRGEIAASCGSITINKNVTVGSLIASGGTVRIDGLIQKELRGTFGKLVLEGDVSGYLNCKGSYLYINGVVNGPAVIAAAEQIEVGNNAKFLSTVRYWSPQKRIHFRQSITQTAYFDKDLKIGREHWYFLGFTSVLSVIWYLAMVLTIIFLFQYFFSGIMIQAATTLANSFWRSLLYGIIFWIAVPVIAVLICITIIGLPLGIITLIGYSILLVLATAISAVVISNWIHLQTKTKTNFFKLSMSAMAIFIVLKIVTFLPIIGWLLMVVIASASFGAILMNIKWKAFTNKNNPKVAAG